MKKELVGIVENYFPFEKFFLVEVSLVMLRSIPKLKVVADSDIGIGIDECASISRSLSKLIEESGITENFEIEVSSPGVGEPLLLERQYIKNIGRKVKVVAKDGKVVVGKLLHINPTDFIDIEEIVKLKGIKEPEIIVHQILFSDIKKTTVEISFN